MLILMNLIQMLYIIAVIVKSVMKRYCPKVLMVALLAYLLGCKHIEIVLVMKLAQILLTIQQLNLSISHYQRIIKN